MPLYQVVVTFVVEAESEQDAVFVAEDSVTEPDVSVISVKELEE